MYFLKLLGIIVMFIVTVMFSKLLLFEPLVSKFASETHVKPVTAVFTTLFQVGLFILLAKVLQLEHSLKLIDFGIGAFVSVVILIVVVSILVISNSITFELQSSYQKIVLTLISFTLVTVLFEEIVFRGLIYGGLRHNLNFIVAFSISIIIFVIPHLFNKGINLFSVTSVFLGGYILTILYEITGSLLAPIGFHFTWNFTQSSLGFTVSGNEMNGIFKVSFLSKDRLITGGDFGIESSLITLIALLISSVLLTLIYVKKATYS